MDITERVFVSKTMEELSNINSGHVGEKYFVELAKLLSKNLDVKSVLIGEINSENNTIQTLGFACHGREMNNITYSLEDTPCYEVLDVGVCVYEAKVQEVFPKDEDLKVMEAESYIGCPLFNEKGLGIGLISIIHDKPILNSSKHKTILDLVSKRTTLEIERLKEQNVQGIIMDLRGNGGGSLQTVVDMTGLFIEQGPIVQIQSSNKNKRFYMIKILKCNGADR